MIFIAHYVICSVCGERFNRDTTPWVQTSSRRYAHKTCAIASETTRKQEDIDKEELEKYIMKLLKEDYISPRVRKQMNTFIKDYNYTYSGMKKALVYFYEVKGNDPAKANGGIGIIPYIYNDALKYYYALYLAAVANEDKDVEHFQVKVREFSIEPPVRIIKPPRLFNLDDLEEEE